jgi:saccharopine dehydrogenase-like NADP-dependent oxidoreductase
MSDDRKRIVLVGASGVFGSRLAAMIARWPDVVLVLAARALPPLEALAAELAKTRPAARIEVARLDRLDPKGLAALGAWAVVDAAGPFQGQDHTFPRAVLDARAHYLDLADARDFVAGFEAALDGPARAAKRWAITGASSTPALSHAALDAMTAGWTRIERIEAAISPGARAPRGLSVIRAILAWAGGPVRVFWRGHWTTRPGWSDPRRIPFPGLGRRWTSLAETPDLDLLPARFHVRRDAIFRAGLELPILHLGLWALSLLRRARLVSTLEPLAVLLGEAAGWFAPLGSDRGGMVVSAEGLDADGARRLARWSLCAEAGAARRQAGRAPRHALRRPGRSRRHPARTARPADPHPIGKSEPGHARSVSPPAGRGLGGPARGRPPRPCRPGSCHSDRPGPSTRRARPARPGPSPPRSAAGRSPRDNRDHHANGER